MIKQIMTFKSLYRKKLSKLYLIEQDNKKKKEEEIGKTVIFKNEDNLVVKNKSNNLLSNDYSFDVKKHKKLKMFKELVYHYTITILIIIGFSIPLYFMLPHTINYTCGLIYSHTYLLENFLYTSAALLEMKCKITKCNITNTFNYTNVLNNNLRFELYKTLPKFPLFYDFYHNGYMKDSCYSLYYNETEKYDNCKNNNSFVIILNSTDSTKTIILNMIEKQLYELETSSEENPNFSHLTLLNSSDYGMVLFIYDIYYMPVVDIMNKIVEQSFVHKINLFKKKLIIINVVFGILNLINVFYVNFVFLPLLVKRICISRSFVYIIPSSYISSTQVLENWLEKIDNKK